MFHYNKNPNQSIDLTLDFVNISIQYRGSGEMVYNNINSKNMHVTHLSVCGVCVCVCALIVHFPSDTQQHLV